MNPILQDITSAVILCLDKRFDTSIPIIEKYASFGIKVQPFICGSGKLPIRYNYVDTQERSPYSNFYLKMKKQVRINAYNCWKCHHIILKDFVIKNKSDANLLMIEDDIEIHDDFLEILDKITEYFKYYQCDMLYLGATHTSTSWGPSYHPNLIKLKGSGGFHSVLISHKVCRFLLEFPPISPFDDLAAKYVHPNFHCYSIYPSIVTQKNGYSCLEDQTILRGDRWWLGKDGLTYKEIS